mgnify:CR=1 FL=1
MSYGKRIDTLCSLLDKVETFADVGCDHGYCSEYMLKNGLCDFDDMIIEEDGYYYYIGDGEYELISCDSSNITHTHNFIDGVCDCGKKESDTTPPHEHSFVNGKCECGEEQGLVDGEYSQGLEYTLSDDESYYILSGIGSCTDTIINIPSLYKDKPVEIIKDHAFANNYSLIGVNISKSIKLIDESSFYSCVNLKTVIFEEESTLEAINRDAFMGCGLTSIIIPNSLKTIGVDAFSYSGLETVTFEENSELELIGYNAFRVCKYLVSIVIPEGVTTIQNSAFWRCESLRNVILPHSLKEIGYEVFEDCYSLESIIGIEVAEKFSSVFETN